jgi:hypothetical protein
MRNKSQNGKMTIEASNIIEEKNNFKIVSNKSKSLNKKLRKREEVKQLEVVIEKKYINFNLDFIYRRERYTLKNVFSNCLISRIKKLIGKKISVDANLIHIFYLDKEITNDKLNVYDMMQNKRIKFLEVKKESPINEEVISLNTNIHLIYKIRCKGILNVKDFIEKIETFFRERCLDKYYLCEPIGNNTYDVAFSCEDNCFQFKRYMMLVKKLDNNYKNTIYQFIPLDRNEILQPIKQKNIQQRFYRNSESIFINKGPYITYEEIQKRNEREEKKKWISKKDFIYKK